MRHRKVLLVDDEKIVLEGFRRLVAWDRYGCEVIGEATDGREAVMKAKQLNPDLIVMDINLPVMNGIDCVRVIQDSGSAAQFIMVTGYDSINYCQEALRLRVHDYILKPIDFEEFSEVLSKLGGAGAQGGSYSSMEQILQWIDRNLGEEVSLNRLSQECHLNSSYISQLFRREMGVNFQTYLTRQRVRRAEKLLMETERSVTEISGLVGFHDYRAFIRMFRNETGETPAVFRKNRS